MRFTQKIEICFIAFLMLQCSGLFAQTHAKIDSTYIPLLDVNPRYYNQNDTQWVYSGICKVLKIRKQSSDKSLSDISRGSQKHSPFLSIHGNLQYDYLYRSFADTPFYQKDFRQHTLQTFLTVTVKDKYPLQVNFIIRKSNSPFFKNFFDGGVVFDRLAYYRNLQKKVLAKIIEKIPGQSYLDEAKKLLRDEAQKYNLLKGQLSANGLAQQIIEEKEKKYFQSLQSSQVNISANRLVNVDSLKENLSAQVEQKRKELDSLQNNISRLQAKVDSMENKLSADIAYVRQKINKATNPGELMNISNKYGVEDKKQKWENFISGVKKIGIGRSVLDYSELTARNVSLTGLNIEYNSRFYSAIAVGKIDYGFRDFFGKNTRTLNQYLLMGRIGVGDIEKKAIIFSLFTGRKASYGSLILDTVNNNVLVTGYSIEAIIKKDQYTQFSAEIAKSTRPLTGRLNDNKERGKLFNFSDNTNLGISIKGQTIVHETKTRLSGLFRKTGENFQSFSLFGYNSDQTAWMLKAEQPFMKERINVSGALRRNDFVNPFTEKTFKTTTIFGSIQLSVRIPKWPSLSIGYYPGSQLYIIDRDRIRENVYYIFNGTLVHQYKLAGLQMVSSAIYNNYTTKGTDSGFINYSGKSYMFSHSVSWQRLQLQGNIMYTDQQELQFYTVDANACYSIGDVIKIGGGVKYNKIISGSYYWGGTGQLSFNVKRMGSLQLQYDKSFLPTIQQTLFPVEFGRLTWFKTF